jgi:hypothetical protein
MTCPFADFSGRRHSKFTVIPGFYSDSKHRRIERHAEITCYIHRMICGFYLPMRRIRAIISA